MRILILIKQAVRNCQKMSNLWLVLVAHKDWYAPLSIKKGLAVIVAVQRTVVA